VVFWQIKRGEIVPVILNLLLETLKPMFEKISVIWFLTNEMGWREPMVTGSPGRVKSP
jgi:hypothetical protein